MVVMFGSLIESLIQGNRSGHQSPEFQLMFLVFKCKRIKLQAEKIRKSSARWGSLSCGVLHVARGSR